MNKSVVTSPDSHWLLLMHEAEQPSGVRDTYGLLADFVRALGEPPNVAVQALEGDAARRLGYLVMATKAMTYASVHEAWQRLAVRLLEESSQLKEPIVLFRAEPGSNRVDDLAKLWGIRRGIDHLKLVRIADYGA